MIDFRYHLVSLISVFLALAVGIILGAGPLQGALGDQLTDQVAQLRTERNDLRDQLSASEATTEQQLTFIQAAGPQLVAGTLEGKRVAVVDLDDVAGDVEQGVVDQVEAAGGTIVASAVLTPAWTDADHADFRDTIAGGLREPLAEAGADDEDAETPETLAAALAVALTGASGPDAHARSEQGSALEQQLVQADLLEVEGEQTAPADAVVLMSGTTADQAADGENAEPTPEQEAVRTFAELARTVQSVAPATVVAGPTASDGDLVSAVRSDDAIADVVSTVSGIETPVGRIVVPLALAASLADEVGQYGFEDGATPLPPVVPSATPTGSGS
ncbi:copper transporter [Puerhibacterium puerhi]|uniref:copper transporter n=1 Tax=Puerhibacterium puerhi TaxID=2692623 RepID=UPI001358F869|nr:copper transporter [Puerhibacterium puerhi]